MNPPPVWVEEEAVEEAAGCVRKHLHVGRRGERLRMGAVTSAAAATDAAAASAAASSKKAPVELS